MRPQLSSNAVVDVVDTFVVLFVHGQYLTDQEGGGWGGGRNTLHGYIYQIWSSYASAGGLMPNYGYSSLITST